MNRAQIIAYNNPCFIADETRHPRFRHVHKLSKGWFATAILTANIGEE